MDDLATYSMPTETTGRAGRARRGRPPKESPAERLSRLQQQLQEARQAVAAMERRTYEIVGAAVLEEAATDGALQARVTDILRRRVTTASARADIATLLAK
jgi:hypothetical protein